MKRILYSKDIQHRLSFVESVYSRLIKAGLVDNIAYLLPKKFMAEVSQHFPGCTFQAYEDVVKSNTLFNLDTERTLLVLDRPARYKNITSNTFVRLSRLTAKFRHRMLVDIVPFTASIEYLYAPLAFVDRSILGYQHGYAFRENNWEITEANDPVRAHDIGLLARKLAPVADIDYSDLLGNQVEIVHAPLTRGEAAEYEQKRDELFITENSERPVITRLADWTNIRESRYERLQSLLSTLPGNTVIYTNLSGHNKRLLKRFPGLKVKSFYDANGTEDQYDQVVLFELPIVKGYLFLDVIANVRPDCRVMVFRSNTTVDDMLAKDLFDQYEQINQLAQALHKEVHNERRQKDVSQ
ncbi:hypothetical protein ACIFOE_25710 [Paenibacillus sp. NRS-1783]|uniref:hypothetical protein n=1 Tax=Paenibacillus sp. NRS-1783 TaxID=3233907 RepID=UPI003D28E87B